MTALLIAGAVVGFLTMCSGLVSFGPNCALGGSGTKSCAAFAIGAVIFANCLAVLVS